jgi:hypothetical protein
MITTHTRDASFILLGKTQELHLAICRVLVEPTDELKEKVLLMREELKILAREL